MLVDKSQPQGYSIGMLTYDQAKWAAFDMIRECGELSYSDLVFRLGLTIEEVVQVFDDLEEEGYVREKPTAVASA